MSKFHNSPTTGKPERCHAEYSCRLGGEHYDSVSSAYEGMAKELEETHGLFNKSLKNEKDREEASELIQKIAKSNALEERMREQSRERLYSDKELGLALGVVTTGVLGTLAGAVAIASAGAGNGVVIGATVGGAALTVAGFLGRIVIPEIREELARRKSEKLRNKLMAKLGKVVTNPEKDEFEDTIYAEPAMKLPNSDTHTTDYSKGSLDFDTSIESLHGRKMQIT